MSFQHLLPLERLATKVADEGQRISMQVEMPFQMPFEREAWNFEINKCRPFLV